MHINSSSFKMTLMAECNFVMQLMVPCYTLQLLFYRTVNSSFQIHFLIHFFTAFRKWDINYNHCIHTIGSKIIRLLVLILAIVFWFYCVFFKNYYYQHKD